MPVINPLAGPVTPDGPAPCLWEVNTGCCSDWDSHPQSVKDNAVAWSTQILWALTGRQFGTCEVTVRPCGTTCNVYGGWMTWPVIADGVESVSAPFIRDGQWFNCGCGGGCTCKPRCAVWLPGPVASVAEVLVDGVVINPSMYRVDNRDTLVGLNGQCWPDCQNLSLESPEEGTFEVTYRRGTPLPMAGQIAAGIYACEFAKACQGDDCRLPSNVSSLARQGIQVEMIDPTDALTDGLTGLPDVDTWIRSVNPSKLPRRMRVWSPDVHIPTMRTS